MTTSLTQDRLASPQGTGYLGLRTGGPPAIAIEAQAVVSLARIFSVVDSYDALINERPYRRAWPHAEAMAELRRCSGSQFDPGIVAVFEPPDLEQRP